MRDNIDIYFMKMTYLISERSTCLRRKVGCAIVKNNQIISAGYNGVPTKLPHCKTCLRQELNIPSGEKSELCKACHAEQNAITCAAKNGINIENSTIYCTTQPCLTCAKMIVNAGIKRIVFCEDYSKGFDDLTQFILQNILVQKINMNTQELITLIGDDK